MSNCDHSWSHRARFDTVESRPAYAPAAVVTDYDRTIEEILKALATDEASIGADYMAGYLRKHTELLAPKYEATIDLWLSRIEITEQLSGKRDQEIPDNDTHGPNDYDPESHRDT